MPDVQRASWEVVSARLSAHSPWCETTGGVWPCASSALQTSFLDSVLFAFVGWVPAESPCSGFLGTQTGARGKLSYSRKGEEHLDARDYISPLPLQLGQVT